MKKIYILLFIIVPGFINAQNITLDFEQWDTAHPANPKGWFSANFLNAYSSQPPVIKAGNSHGGNYCAQIRTFKVINNPPGFGANYPGFIWTGNFDGLHINSGYPYTKQPLNINFWYKYLPNGDDTAYFLVYLTRWNSIALKRDTVAYSVYAILDYTPDFTLISSPFYYASGNTEPDSAHIEVFATSFTPQDSGTILYIDDIEYKGSLPVGIDEPLVQETIRLFPNPCGNYLEVWNANGPYIVFNIRGQIVSALALSHIGKAQFRLDVSNLEPGLYFLKDSQGRSGKFMKSAE